MQKGDAETRDAGGLLPVQLQAGTLSVQGEPILSGLCEGAFRSGTEADCGLVLGLRAASGREAALEEVALGSLHCSRFLACSRIKLYWMSPAWGRRARDLPPETQFLLLELASGGPYAAILPLLANGGTFRATLRPGGRGGPPDALRLRVESGLDSVAAAHWDGVALVAAGRDPFALVDAAVVAAARLSGTARPRAERAMPALLDSFGWCTWDAFFSAVSAKGLSQGLDALQAGGITPGFVIIDDGWQCTANDGEGPPQGGRAPSSRDQRQQARDEAEYEVLLSHTKGAGSALSNLAYQAAVKRESAREGAGEGQASPNAARKAALQSQKTLGPASLCRVEVVPEGATAPPHTATVQTQMPSPPRKGPQGGRADVAAAPAWGAGGLGVQWARVLGKLQGLLMLLLTLLYVNFIEHAPADSLRIRVFSYLVQGPLRGAMLRYEEQSGDWARRLTSVRANAKFGGPATGPDAPPGGPEDLKAVVAHLKGMYGVKQVLCWHSLQGYWAGLAKGLQGLDGRPLPVQKIFPKPSAGVLEVDPCYAWSPQILAGVGVAPDPAQLYGSMHTYLAGAGVDGVKVDCQATLDMMGGARGQAGASAMSGEYHAALEASVQRHFPGNAAINCMCHSTNDIYRMAATPLVRSSDDFWPRDPASHTTHVAVNAYNSLFLAPLLQPDWDMFHSAHAASRLHAVARVVSGGPVYVSDRPGSHDFALLQRLALPGGGVLRCTHPGRPTRDTLFCDPMRDDQTLLKVWNSTPCGAVVGAFNLQGAAWDRAERRFREHDPWAPTLEGAVSLRDIPQYAGDDAGRYVAWSDAKQEAAELAGGGSVPLRLSPGHSDLITIMPLTPLGGGKWAGPIGLVNMLNAGAAVASASFSARPAREGPPLPEGWAGKAPGGRALAGALTLAIKGLGTLAVYSTAPPRACLRGQQEVAFEYAAARRLVRVTLPREEALESKVTLLY